MPCAQAGELREFVLQEANVREVEICTDLLEYASVRAEPNYQVAPQMHLDASGQEESAHPLYLLMAATRRPARKDSATFCTSSLHLQTQETGHRRSLHSLLISLLMTAAGAGEEGREGAGQGQGRADRHDARGDCCL